MIGPLLYLLLVFVILGGVWYILTLFPLPAPFPMVIRVIFLLIALIIVIDFLLSLAGGGWRPLGLHSW